MARTVTVAFLFLVLRLSLASNDFTKPLGNIHNYTQMIEYLFRTPKTYYVAGGTFKIDPLIEIVQYPFKCGKVITKQSILDHKVSIERQFLQKDSRTPGNTKENWRWLRTPYDLEAKKSSEYNYSNYVEVFKKSSSHQLLGSMYLLLSDFLTCALFYNGHSNDCELWVTEEPVREKAINVSFCGAFISTCNDKEVRWYYNDDDCYKNWP